MEGRVVHCKREKFEVYIGRPSKWGNPFVLGVDGTREEVIAKYRAWLMDRVVSRRIDVSELRGKVLGCWCAPKACHGDVLLEMAEAFTLNSAPQPSQERAEGEANE